MSYKEEIGFFLNVAVTPSTTIDIADFCETDDPDGLVPSQPLSLRQNWRQLIADRIVDDILQDHVTQATIKAMLDINTFVLFSRNRNGEEALCGLPTGTSSIAADFSCCRAPTECHNDSTVLAPRVEFGCTKSA
jgi:hypothetical protein